MTTTHTTRPNLAVLIDADNISAGHAAQVMAKVAELGRPTDRRAYGDWTTPHLASWKRVLHTLGIRPQQQFSYTKGKNSTDGALIMDAMELIFGRQVDGICIVSSDSDYIGLAARIQSAGLSVYGFGTRQAQRDFVAACDAFHFLDQPDCEAAADPAPAPIGQV